MARLKLYFHFMGCECLRMINKAKRLADPGMAFRLEQHHREGDILSRQFRPIVKAGFRPERKTVDMPIGVTRHTMRYKPIHGVRLIKRAHHQAIEC